VAELLRVRKSEKLILAREAGQFDAFFHDLYDRRVRRTHDHARRVQTRDALTVDPQGPYKLLEAMEVRDATVHHGREEELGAIERDLESHEVVVVFGEPGMGKTSLVQAGLAKRLQDEGATVVCFRAGTDPRREAVAALAHALDETSDADAVPESLSVLEAARAAHERTPSQIVLIVDQAEELITRVGPRTARSFAEQLAEFLADRDMGGRVVLVVSSAGLSMLSDLKPILPGIYHAAHRVGRLSRNHARQVVVRSAARFERRWEDELLEDLLDDLGPDTIHPSELELVCYRCYSLLGRARVVQPRYYEAVGRSEKVLRTLLPEAIRGIPWWDREAARQVLRALVRSGPARGPLTLEQVVARCPRLDTSRVERLLWALADAHLVHRLGRETGRTYEIVNNWIVPLVAEGMTADDRAQREAEDAIVRLMTDWVHYREPLDIATLRAATELRGKLRLTKAELAFAIASAALREHALDAWFELSGQLEDREVPVLGQFLGEAPEPAQLKAAERLSAIGSEAAVKVLLDAMNDVAPAVKQVVGAALEKRGHVVAAAVRETTGHDRTRALVALGSVGTAEVVEPLIAVVQDASEDASVREVAVEALATVAPKTSVRASASLISGLTDLADDAIDEEGARALVRVAVAEGEVELLQRSANTTSRAPSLRYAAALAACELRDIDQADHHLAALLEESPSLGGADSVVALRDSVRGLGERISAGYLEWAMFRKDPAHTAASAQDGPGSRPEVLWRSRAHGQVVGSPSIMGGHCFFGARDGFLRAVESQTGREVWARKLAASIESSPAVSDELVVVGCLDHHVYACDRRSGRIRWRAQTGGEVRGSPTVADGCVFVGSWDGELYCLDLAKGDVLWTLQTGGSIYASPAVWNGRVYVGSWCGRVFCIDAGTGAELFTLEAGAEVNSSAAVSASGRVAVGTDTGHVLVFGADEPGEVLRYASFGPVRSSPAVADDVVYVGSDDMRLHAFSAESGDPVFALQTGEPVVGSPAVTPSHIVFGSRDGNVYCVARETGEEVYRVQSPYSVVSSPAVVDGVVYIGMEYYEVVALAAPQGTDL
jgi:outer membrane protein assembly factor BamB/energy-coupling factor transporter ATP-binding protein EcfA2